MKRGRWKLIRARLSEVVRPTGAGASMKTWVVCLIAAAWAGALAPGAYAMQERTAVQAVRVSPDTVELGDPFTLRVSVHLPSGRDLRVPETLLPEWGVESLGSVRTESVLAGNGSAQVVLEYDLIPFEIGLAATPQLEIASGEAMSGEGRVRVEITQITQNAENVVQPDVPAVPILAGADRSSDRLIVAGRRVFVTSPVLLDDIAGGLQPRPPADVVGSNWNLPAVLGASLLSLLLLGVLTVQAREWLAARAVAAMRVEAPPETPDVWRRRALDRLDRLLGSGDHRKGRVRAFHEGASEVVREYVEHFDPAWNRSWTSTELMRGMTAEAGWPDLVALQRAMEQAEVVKFAGTAGVGDVAAEAAELDWRTMRAWVDESERAPAFASMRVATEGDPAAAEEEAADPQGREASDVPDSDEMDSTRGAGPAVANAGEATP